MSSPPSVLKTDAPTDASGVADLPERPRPRLRRRLVRPLAAVAALALAAAVPLAYELGRAEGTEGAAAAPPAAVAAGPASDAAGALPALSDGPWLDAEYDYLGALRTWPASPGRTALDPFKGVSERRLVVAGRTVCTRAQDPGMNADGMLDLLDMDPHKTFVVVTESLDKLCPSQASRLPALTTGR
jgi:hypothetical protein